MKTIILILFSLNLCTSQVRPEYYLNQIVDTNYYLIYDNGNRMSVSDRDTNIIAPCIVLVGFGKPEPQIDTVTVIMLVYDSSNESLYDLLGYEKRRLDYFTKHAPSETDGICFLTGSCQEIPYYNTIGYLDEQLKPLSGALCVIKSGIVKGTIEKYFYK